MKIWGLGLFLCLGLVACIACSEDDGTEHDHDGTGGKQTGTGGATGGKDGSGGATGGKGGATGGKGGATGGKGGAGGNGGEPPDGRAPSCDDCARDLAPAFSLDCYCASHDCSSSLRASANSGEWLRGESGCGYTAFFYTFGAGDGNSELFDSKGKLIGASRWSDFSSTNACITPQTNEDGTATGGIWVDGYDGLYPICKEQIHRCVFKRDNHPTPDAGADAGPKVPFCEDLYGGTPDGGTPDSGADGG